jgi:hypothetical protein
MKRNHGTRNRYPGYYRVDKLRRALDGAGFKSPYALAKHLGLNADTTYRVFKGTASHKQVWPIANYLKVDWRDLHDLNSPVEKLGIHRAVLNGGSRSVR